MAAEPSMAMPSTRVASWRTARARSSLPSASMSDDALAELGRPRLEAHEQLGVVGAGELGQHQAVGLVVADGEAAGGAERHVVELLDGVEDLLRGPRPRRPSEPCRTRETVAIETPARSATE